MKNIGFHADRLDAQRDNPYEVVFAELWESENVRGCANAHVLDCVLEGAISARDIAVAASVVQWLGSNVGFNFVTEALDRCGFDITQRKRKAAGKAAPDGQRRRA